MLWCTYIIFSAVQRWPLNDNAPVTVSENANLISAFCVMMAAFLASNPNMALKRFTLGCSFFNSLATLLEPMSVNTSILPDCIKAGTIAWPLPYMVFTTPLGKDSWKAFNNG